MSERWNKPGVPHKGWTLVDVYDTVEDETESVDDRNYETCEMCGNNPIRYVHVVSHPEVDGEFHVGCDCAEHMTSDYVTPKRREKELRRKAVQRANFVKRKWRESAKGNWYLRVEGHILVIYREQSSGQWKGIIDDRKGKKKFESLREAKLAIHKSIEVLKERDEW